MGWDGQSSVVEDEMKQDRRALRMALKIPIIAMKVMIARLWYSSGGRWWKVGGHRV